MNNQVLTHLVIPLIWAIKTSRFTGRMMKSSAPASRNLATRLGFFRADRIIIGALLNVRMYLQKSRPVCQELVIPIMKISGVKFLAISAAFSSNTTEIISNFNGERELRSSCSVSESSSIINIFGVTITSRWIILFCKN